MKYHITKGQQYDRNGAHVSWRGSLSAKYKADGSYDAGDFLPLHDEAVVEEAIRRVISTGISETVDTSVPRTAEQDAEAAKMKDLYDRRDAYMRANGFEV